MTARLAFNLLVLAFAGYFVWSAMDYEYQAQRIPLLIGGLVIILQSWVTIQDVLKPSTVTVIEGAELPPLRVELTRVAAVSGWMLLYFALFTLAGTLAATFLFILLFLILRRDVRKWVAIALAGSVSVLIWLVFVHLMRFQLYPGVMFGGTLPPL